MKAQKTIYLKRKRSGNYEFSNKENHTIKFSTYKSLKQWYNKFRYGKVIKAVYRLSNTYFTSYKELEAFIKKERKEQS